MAQQTFKEIPEDLYKLWFKEVKIGCIMFNTTINPDGTWNMHPWETRWGANLN